MYNELTEASKHKNAKPIVAVPECITDEGPSRPQIQRYEQIEALAFLAIVAKARGICWFSAPHATKTVFDWISLVAKNKIVPLVPIILTDDLSKEAKPKNSDVYTLSKKYNEDYYVISVNSIDKELKDVEIVMPAEWKGVKVEDFYKKTILDVYNGTIKVNYGPYEVKVYKIF